MTDGAAGRGAAAVVLLADSSFATGVESFGALVAAQPARANAMTGTASGESFI
jgi:hypothetical protein